MTKKIDVHINSCLECNECCWNVNPTLTVIFTAKEVAAIKSSGFSPLPQFLSYRGDACVFTVTLVHAAVHNRLVYTCPFYDYAIHQCRIYYLRPFDCRAWPYFFARGKDPREVFLKCYDGWCPVINKKNMINSRKIDQLLSPESIAILKHYPGLIWDYSEEQPFQAIENITLRLQS
ncbi:MAG: YkgJ family cysteine cluster protein [Anaerolineaceae bacterium]